MKTSENASHYDLLGYLRDHSEDIPSASFSAEEVAAIRSLANGYTEEDAISHIRKLATSYQTSNLARRLEKIRVEEHSSTQSAAPADSILINSCQTARIAIFAKNPNAHINFIRKEVISLQAPDLFRIPTLDQRYGYKGGAARIALGAALGDSTAGFAPRDLDLIRFGNRHITEDDEMAQQFMPDDFKHGHGVELKQNYREYFTSRDLTVNEVVFIGASVICSPRALQDSINQVLRPTQHVLNESGNPPGKIVMKMIRILAEERTRGRQMTIHGVPEDLTVTPFDIALHLDRALHQSSRIASVFIKECVDRGYLESHKGRICLGSTIQHLEHAVPQGLNSFKKLSAEKRSNRRKKRRSQSTTVSMPFSK